MRLYKLNKKNDVVCKYHDIYLIIPSCTLLHARDVSVFHATYMCSSRIISSAAILLTNHTFVPQTIKRSFPACMSNMALLLIGSLQKYYRCALQYAGEIKTNRNCLFAMHDWPKGCLAHQKLKWARHLQTNYMSWADIISCPHVKIYPQKIHTHKQKYIWYVYKPIRYSCVPKLN